MICQVRAGRKRPNVRAEAGSTAGRTTWPGYGSLPRGRLLGLASSEWVRHTSKLRQRVIELIAVLTFGDDDLEISTQTRKLPSTRVRHDRDRETWDASIHRARVL